MLLTPRLLTLISSLFPFHIPTPLFHSHLPSTHSPLPSHTSFDRQQKGEAKGWSSPPLPHTHRLTSSYMAGPVDGREDGPPHPTQTRKLTASYRAVQRPKCRQMTRGRVSKMCEKTRSKNADAMGDEAKPKRRDFLSGKCERRWDTI